MVKISYINNSPIAVPFTSVMIISKSCGNGLLMKMLKGSGGLLLSILNNDLLKYTALAASKYKHK